MPRLFTGLEIPAEIRLALSAFRGGLPGARWVEPANYHVTLRFIGDIEEGLARDVTSILSEAAPRPPVTVTLEGLDSFGGRMPRIVMARAQASEALSALQAENEGLLRRVGLPPEGKRFVPHVTLARLKGASPAAVARYLAMHGAFPRLSFTAQRFALFSSRASSGGGPYIVEAAYPLGAM